MRARRHVLVLTVWAYLGGGPCIEPSGQTTPLAEAAYKPALLAARTEVLKVLPLRMHFAHSIPRLLASGSLGAADPPSYPNRTLCLGRSFVCLRARG